MEKEINQIPEIKKATKKGIPVIFMTISVVIIFSLIIYFIWSKKQKTEVVSNQPTTQTDQNANTEPLKIPQDDFVPKIKNEVFIAWNENDTLKIVRFDPVNKKIIENKNFLNAGYPSIFGAFGFNNAVQFNPLTEEIFYSTQGYSVFSGACTNTDGTCTSRIYKIGAKQKKPTIFFESDDSLENWIINSFDNSLLLILVKDNKRMLVKLDGNNGKIIFEKEYLLNEYSGFTTDFVVSNDGKFTYQTSIESVKSSASSGSFDILKLRKINNTNGDISEQKIFTGENIENNSYLSPNEDYIAFYSRINWTAKLYIYQISTKKLINVPYPNSTKSSELLWSGDSKKLLILLEDSLAYYDLPTSKNILIGGDVQQITYIYNCKTSTDYLIYRSTNGEIKIFDWQNNQDIDTGIKYGGDLGEVVGISWY